MTEHCKWPKCDKPLPSDFKIPLCDYHKGIMKEGATKVVGGLATVASGVAIAVIRNFIRK